MEPNIDRSSWSVVALIVVGLALLVIRIQFPELMETIFTKLSELITGIDFGLSLFDPFMF